MIKLENLETFGWEAAIRGMRNPMNSWSKSDSRWGGFYTGDKYTVVQKIDDDMKFYVGPNDLKLMKQLANAGNDHAKYLRMINVTVDILAPLYWWKEFDTYKVGTVANSCSTMHKIADKEFTLDDFSHEHLHTEEIDLMLTIITYLNSWRRLYLESQNKEDWWQMIQLLPSSYNQRRTVQMNYQVLANIYPSRALHKLDEWRYFCRWIEDLPLAKDIILKEERPR